MYLRNFTLMIFLLFIFWACNSKNDTEQQNTENTTTQRNEADSTNLAPNPANMNQQSQAGEISDEELQQFGSVVQYAQLVTQQAQQKMVSTVQQSGLEVQRFNEILQAQRNPNEQVNATDDELKKYEAAAGELNKIQMQVQNRMQDKLKNEGLTENRYREIGMAIQNNLELQERFRTVQEQTNQ
jgi:hypothetical protein